MSLDHVPPRHRQDPRRHRRQLDPRVLEDLLQALRLGRPHVDLRLASSGEVAKLTDRRRGHEASTDHPVGDHVGQPLGIGHVGLAPGDVLDVMGVAQPQLEALAFQGVVRRLPVHARRLHTDNDHAMFGQPVAKAAQPGRHGREPLLVGDGSLPLAGHPHARGHAVAVHVQSRNPLVNLFHRLLLGSGFGERPPGRARQLCDSAVRAQGDNPGSRRSQHQTSCGLKAPIRRR